MIAPLAICAPAYTTAPQHTVTSALENERTELGAGGARPGSEPRPLAEHRAVLDDAALADPVPAWTTAPEPIADPAPIRAPA